MMLFLVLAFLVVSGLSLYLVNHVHKNRFHLYVVIIIYGIFGLLTLILVYEMTILEEAHV